jgi:phage repressor protein C with HTH and peptisase S24 domain
MNKKDRLKALIQHYGEGKPTTFAKYIGVAPSTISSWLARDAMDYDLVFSKCTGVSSRWLLTGEGDIEENFANCKINQEENSKKDAEISYDPSVGTPYYDVDFFGGFSEIFNDQTRLPACNIVVPGLERATVWCNVTGHSMEPRINHGDIIALRECTIQDIQYGETYAVVLDTIRTIKILRRGSSPSTLLYVPVNKSEYDDQEFDISRIIKIFEVVGSISKFF